MFFHHLLHLHFHHILFQSNQIVARPMKKSKITNRHFLRSLLHSEEKLNDERDANAVVGKILISRGQFLFECLVEGGDGGCSGGDEATILCELPQKFRGLMWLKRGGGC